MTIVALMAARGSSKRVLRYGFPLDHFSSVGIDTEEGWEAAEALVVAKGLQKK